MPRKIIIDTDPGTDDAVAILLALAAPELEVLGLVAVAGNLRLGVTERNARALCEVAGRSEVPVYAGCARPILRAPVTAEHVHGPGGLGDLALPPPKKALHPEHGVDFLIETLRREPAGEVTLCALGPLTDVAMALVKAPDIAGKIGALVLMGGGDKPRSTVSPVAEFNIHADPVAAAIVFDSAVPITMIPMDVTQQAINTPKRVAAVRALGNRCGEAAAAMMARERRGQFNPPLHDPCVIAYLLEPEIFDGSAVNVAVETGSALTMGMTVIDWRSVTGRKPNATVILKIDVDRYYRLLTDKLARLP